MRKLQVKSDLHVMASFGEKQSWEASWMVET